MSDLAAAASALSAPEELVLRSATARAAAGGGSVDDILTAWAGGAPAPAASAPPAAAEVAPTAAPEPVADVAPTPAPAVSTPALSPAPAAPAPVLVATGPVKPPVLEGRHEQPFLYMLGGAALLIVALVVGFFAPAMAGDGNGVYSSAQPHTQEGLDGRDVYRSEGCGACHTQQVRPLVADAELGPVTSPDTNQVIGVRRYGPDLSHIGSRVESPSEILSVLANSSDHASYAGLSEEDLANLTTYLFESK